MSHGFTEGSRGGLERACITAPHPYGCTNRPTPIIERRLRYEVNERVNFRGEVLAPFDVADVAQVA